MPYIRISALFKEELPPESCTNMRNQLSLMNMYLHNIRDIDGDVLISSNDSLVAPSSQSYDYVLANPPFGKKSSMSFTNEEGEEETDDLTYNRQDFLERSRFRCASPRESRSAIWPWTCPHF